MIRIALIAAALVLSGCAAAVPAVAVTGGVASVWTAAVQTDKTADALLAADAPIKRAICADIHPDPVKHPKTAAWCANIPTTVAGLALQWGIVAATPSP